MSVIATASPLERLPAHAVQMVKRDFPSSGFTAVNGESQNGLCLPVDESRKGLAIDDEQSQSQETDSSSARFHSHGWRPERNSDPTWCEVLEPKKRKRSDSTEVGAANSSESYNHGGVSPKRRAPGLNGAVNGITSARTSYAILPFQAEHRPRDTLPMGVHLGYVTYQGHGL